jgi:alpha-1,2-mannosyltransferase
MTALPRMYAAALRRDRLYVAAIALLIVSAVAHGQEVITPGLYTRSGDLKGTDFAQFYVMGWLVRSAPIADLYDVDAHRETARHHIDPRLDTHAPYPNYGPQVALIFAPLSTLPYHRSLGLLTFLSVCAYAVAVWLLTRGTLALSREWPLVLLLAAASPALLATLRFGQLSTFSLLFLAFSIEALRQGRSFLAGLCLGALAFKPSLLVVAGPALLLAREWRCAFGLAVAGALHLAGGWAAGGGEGLRLYLHALLTLAAEPDRVVLFPHVAHSVRGFLRLAGASPAAASAASALALVTAIVLVWRIWRREQDALIRVAFVVLGTVLATPHLMTYDLLLLTVALVAAAELLLTSSRSRWTCPLAVATALVYIAPFSPVFAEWTGMQVSTAAIAVLGVTMYIVRHGRSDGRRAVQLHA